MLSNRRIVVATLLFLSIAGGARAETPPADKGKTDPPGVLLEARLVARKNSYGLDRGGKTAEAFRKQLEEWQKSREGELPPSPAVNLVLEFRNTSEKEMRFLIGPDGAEPILNLAGTGAVRVALGMSLVGRRSLAPREVTLAAGKTFEWPIKDLSSHSVVREQFAEYWTQPGEYALTATVFTQVAPAPKGAKDAPEPLRDPVVGQPPPKDGLKWGKVTLTTAPLKLKVVQDKD